MSRGYHRTGGHYRRVRRAAVPFRLRLLLAGIIVLLVATCFLFFGHGLARAKGGAAWKDLIRVSHTPLGRGAVSGPERLIYPYSIVAGGVNSPQQLREAIATDPVAAAHYASFNVAKAHVKKLASDHYAYVSFRVGDNVYWTSHQVKLRKGETLLTDGDHAIRTRCGNRVSQQKRLPIYDHEPSSAMLDTPLSTAPDIETEAFAAIAPRLSSPEFRELQEQPSPLAGVGHQGVSTPSTPYTPFAFFPAPGCNQQDSKAACNNTSLPPGPPPASPTPESAPLLLIVTGAAILGAYGLRRRGREAYAGRSY